MSARPKLLIIEDNTDHRELLSDLFIDACDVTFAESREECMNILGTAGANLVLLDYRLHDSFAGIDLLADITAHIPEVPVIMMTAYGDEELAARAIKAGAADYIRKSPEKDFLKAIRASVREILDARKDVSVNEKKALITFFQEHRKPFQKTWKEKIIFFKEKIETSNDLTVTDRLLNELFEAFLRDLESGEVEETLGMLKRMIWTNTVSISSLLLVELLNTSFKEAARALLMEKFPHTFDGRARFMQRIGLLVDSNDLLLSCEYEKIVRESTSQMLKAERITTKLLLMRTLQHEIRQPLSFIFNSIELLLENKPEEEISTVLQAILQKTGQIDSLLCELEKDSDIPVTRYSDKLPMYDIGTPAPSQEPDGRGELP